MEKYGDNPLLPYRHDTATGENYQEAHDGSRIWNPKYQEKLDDNRKQQAVARDQNIAASNSEHGLTRREYAAIHLRLPDSGNEWLDAMIATSITALDKMLAASAVVPAPVSVLPATPAPSSAELYIGLKAIVNAFAAKEDEPPRPLGTEAEAEAVKAAQILVRWYEKHAPTS